MMNRATVIVVVGAVLTLWRCTPAEEAPIAVQEAVAATPETSPFLVSPSVQAQAPNAQRDLNQLLLYLSDRFQIKPEFAFIDELPANRHVGRHTTLVTWLQFYHISYYHGDQLVWSGSVVLGEKRGVSLTAKRGFQWDLSALEGGRTKVSFRDGSDEWQHTFQPGRSADLMVGLGEKRVYMVHHYLERSAVIGRPDPVKR